MPGQRRYIGPSTTGRAGAVATGVAALGVSAPADPAGHKLEDQFGWLAEVSVNASWFAGIRN